jgi:SAM-dependent methyltransferase
VALPDAQRQWLELVGDAVRDGTFVKLTLSRHRGADATLKNVFIRPVALRAGWRLSFVYRHATRDVTKNLTPNEGLTRIESLLNGEFDTANLFTTGQSAQLDMGDAREPRLAVGRPTHAAAPETRHDRAKKRCMDPKHSPWLRGLGVTTSNGDVRAGMEAKFRQIHRFVEILQHLLAEAQDQGVVLVPPPPGSPAGRLPAQHALKVVDMGCGKGYLTFATYDFLQKSGWPIPQVRGIDVRPDLIQLCNRTARECGLGGLQFEAGAIHSASLDHVDVLIALHACDTATDDAIAKGVKAGASLLLVAPCCHKELRPQLHPPSALAGALKHGILLERQAEIVTDALRAALLEWAGYDAKVFEFISTEHTGKNLMIAAVKRKQPVHPLEAARGVRELASMYAIKTQRLAKRLGFDLTVIT